MLFTTGWKLHLFIWICPIESCMFQCGSNIYYFFLVGRIVF